MSALALAQLHCDMLQPAKYVLTPCRSRAHANYGVGGEQHRALAAAVLQRWHTLLDVSQAFTIERQTLAR